MGQHEFDASHHYPFVESGRKPPEIERTEGCELITPDGRRILDAAGGAIAVNIGHGRREVAEAYAEAAARTSYVVPPFATPARVQLVATLKQRWLPEGLTRIAFASGGSEGMDSAIRLARQHHVSAGRPERWRVIGRDLSYHGTTLSTLSIGGHLSRREGFEPLLLDEVADLPHAPAHYCLRCPLGKSYPDCGVACADAVESLFRELGPDTIAGFVVEPIVGSNAGALVPPDEYLPRIAEICRKYGVLLIADEVMTGFGRTGRNFGVDHWDITPDILVSGKGLTGGYAPIVAICAREEVLEPMAKAGDGMMFFTYGAHSASCAAALAVLDILEREKLVERAARMGTYLDKALDRLRTHPNVGDVRGRGLLWGIELVRDRESLEPFSKESGLVDKVIMAGLGEGVFFYPGGNEPARHVVCLGPPFIVEEAQIDTMVDALGRAVDSAVARVEGQSAAG